MFKWIRWNVRDDTWLPMPLRLWLWKLMVQYLPSFVMKKRKIVDIDKRLVCIRVSGSDGYMFDHICTLSDLKFNVYTLEILGYSYYISNIFLDRHK